MKKNSQTKEPQMCNADVEMLESSHEMLTRLLENGILDEVTDESE